uniref:Putative ovule protein n=1 Tax=Solanum chacoense TaxID=4108 RepID=A0A0V0HC28_SOLCH
MTPSLLLIYFFRFAFEFFFLLSRGSIETTSLPPKVGVRCTFYPPQTPLMGLHWVCFLKLI